MTLRGLSLAGRLALLCGVLVASSSPVRAQTSAVAERHTQQALRAYHALELTRARHHVRAALARCVPGACANEQRAAILVLAGVIEHALDPAGDRTLEYFREAVSADPAVHLHRELASPTLDRLLAEAYATTVSGEGSRPPEVADDADDGASRFFVEAGYGVGVGTIASNDRPDALPRGFAVGTDPQGDADPTNDSLVLGGTPECHRAPDRYCVRVGTPAGLVHGLRLAVGVHLTPDVGLSLRVRYAPGADRHRMGNYALGVRAHYRLRAHSVRFMHVDAFAGVSVGRSPVRPRQTVTAGAETIYRPYVRTGPFGIDFGASLVFRVDPQVGVLVQPTWQLQFPRPNMTFEAVFGVKLDVGQR